MKTAITHMTAAAFATALWIAVPARAVTVLQNHPDLAGPDVVTNAMGSSSFFPDACTNFTVEAWIKPTAYQTRADVYSPVFSVTPTDKPGSSRYIFGLRQRKLSLFQATVASGDRFPVSSADVARDTWTHVAVAHTATNVTFYVNGVPDPTTATGSFLPPVTEYGNSHLTIGGYYSAESLNGNNNYTTARVFQGSLADVRVWTKARTAEEIAADYQSRLRGDEDGLLLYAPFDDANGTVAHDMVSGQSLVVPPTMQFAEDGSLSLAPASAKLIGGGYLASTRTGGNSGASAIVTDVDFSNKGDGTGPDFTFETWLRVPGQFADDQWIFSKYAESGDTGWIGLDVRANTLTPEVVISGQRFTLAEPIEVDRWYHLAATRMGSSYTIYLDGAPAKSGTCRTTGFSVDNAAAPVKLLNAGTNKSFGGDVKEMRIWNVARTAAEIAAYYDKKATGREEGLIGCWHMDEGYGSKVHNAVTGAEQSVAVGGMGLARGSYLVTTGPKQTLVTDAKLTTTDFTLEAWVRDDSPTPRLGDGRGYILSQFQSGKDWVSLCFNGPNRLTPGLRISSSKFFESSKAVEKGRWFHLAGTREGTTVKVYLNGELVNTSTYDGALGVPGANLTFFNLANTSNAHIGGIREARAWSYARTQAQIQQTMFGGLVGNEEGLVGWWPFDQDASATRVLNRKSNDISKYVPTGASWENDGVPLLAAPDLGEEAEQAANFGGGWFSVARTGIHVDATDFTFETWVRPDAYPYNESYLFAQYKEGESNPNRFLMGFHDSGHFGFFIGGTWKDTDETIPLGRWTHLAATRQGSTLRLYVDGALAKTFENYTTLSPWSSDYPHDLTLGGVNGNYAYSSGNYLRNNISRSFRLRSRSGARSGRFSGAWRRPRGRRWRRTSGGGRPSRACSRRWTTPLRRISPSRRWRRSSASASRHSNSASARRWASRRARGSTTAAPAPPRRLFWSRGPPSLPSPSRLDSPPRRLLPPSRRCGRMKGVNDTEKETMEKAVSDVHTLPVGPPAGRRQGAAAHAGRKLPDSRALAQPSERHVLVALWMGCDFGRDANAGIHAEMKERGLPWRIRFTNTENSFLASLRWMLRERRIDAAITCFPLPDAMAALRRAGVPAVLIDRGDAPPPQVFGPRVARVTLDVPAVARAAVDHFLERAAFRSAGFVESRGDAGWSRLRGDACMAEFALRGLRRARFRHRRSAEPDFDRLAAWIRALEKPAAVFAANDATAADVLDLCEAEGIAVPRDVAVLGMDDDPAFCLRCEPHLSSVHFDGVAAGRLAADALASMMAGGAAPPESALRYGATAVVRRASTGAVSTAGALVQKAVDFIEANALRGISLSDVVRHLGVSRALATLRFRQLRGESVLDAIAARRIAEAKRLLADTDRRVDDIARACGYSGAGPLRRAFLAATGSTPGAFRAAAFR